MKPVDLRSYEALLPSKRRPIRFGHKDNTYPSYRMTEQVLELGNNGVFFASKLTVPLTSISNIAFAPAGHDRWGNVLSMATISTNDGATYLLTCIGDMASAAATWNHWVANH